MKQSLMKNLKHSALALAALFAVAALPACYFDNNDCFGYDVAYVVCDDGVEFVQSEYCTPYMDSWGNWYEDCVYDGYYQQRCWEEMRCAKAPECWIDTDCKTKDGYGTCTNNRCNDYGYKPDTNQSDRYDGNSSQNDVTCTQDSDCTAHNMSICVDYGDKKICASQCFNDSNCTSNYKCEFLENNISKGACLKTSYPCNGNGDCPSDMVCQNHMCLVSCRSGDACQSGNASFACVNGYCNT